MKRCVFTSVVLLLGCVFFMSCATTPNTADTQEAPSTIIFDEANQTALFYEGAEISEYTKGALEEALNTDLETKQAEATITLDHGAFVSDERVVLSLGSYGDPSFLESFVDIFMRETFGGPFPPIISSNMKKIYVRYLNAQDKEFLLDLSISDWTIQTIFSAIFPKMTSSYGYTYFTLEGSAIIMIPGGVAIVPIQYIHDATYKPLSLGAVSNNLCYMTVTGTNKHYPLPKPVQRSTAANIQLQRMGRDRYDMVGTITFDTSAGARAASTSMRLQFAKEFSPDFAQGIEPIDEVLQLLFSDITRDESIELIFHLIRQN